jgi:DNA-directed RNA polymerase subunit E'/Rpb7
MEQFNLERALAGEPVITRDGKEVTQLVKFDAPAANYALRGVIDGEIKSWTSDGRFATFSENSPKDIFMKPKENAIWVNAYFGESGNLFIIGFSSEEEAIKAKNGNYVKTVKIDDKP